jgi:putative nucleotidyltransferase with HDIG domain
MNRDEALEFLTEKVQKQNLIKHMLAAEAIMKALARELGQDEERWGLAGLLHDVDIDILADDMTRHSLVSADIVREQGFDDEMVDAVAAHNEAHGLPRNTLMAKALYACDPLTGLITATALVMPDKKLSQINTDKVHKRFYEKRFAANASRENMKSCETELGLPLVKFIEIGVKAMQEIASDLGL